MVSKLNFHFFKSVLLAMSVAFIAVTAVTVAWAQNPQPTKVKNLTPRNTNLNFEDELVEGASQKPELFYLFQQKNFNYKRLIKLRENFRPEMRKTTEDIQRIRSGN